jgi:hypothetical protein
MAKPTHATSNHLLEVKRTSAGAAYTKINAKTPIQQTHRHIKNKKITTLQKVAITIWY